MSKQLLTTTICLTLAVHIGSAACAPNSVKGPVIASGAVTEGPRTADRGGVKRGP